MKKQFIATIFIVQVLTVGGAIAAEDYSGYSNEALFQMKEQVRVMGEEDRQAYQVERRNRIKNMSQEERQIMRNNESVRSERRNSGQGQKLRDGSGNGGQRGNMGGQGMGGGQGRGR